MSEAWREALSAGARAAEGYALAAPPTSALGLAGSRLGRRAGSSLEFQEHRDYQPGDDLRHIDWGAYARSDRLVVKLYREEVVPHLDLLVDASASMVLDGTAKARATLGLAALLARAAANGGYSHRVWLAGEGCEALEGSAGPASLWSLPSFASSASLGDALDRRPPRWRWGGVRLLVSDLLWPEDPRALLARLAPGAAAVAVVELVGRADAEPTLAGNVRLEDCETGRSRELFVDERARARYRQALGRHRESWRRAAREAGAGFVGLTAEELVEGFRPEPLLEADLLRPR